MVHDDYVQFGCAWSAPIGWRNFDASPTLRFERLPVVGRWYTKNDLRFPANVEYGDILKGLPVRPRSCAGVYCSHVLEHLSLDGLRVAMHNTHRMLRPGGVLRFVLPDLELLARRYLEDPSSDAAIDFMRETALGVETRPTGLISVAGVWLGNSRHLWMWDYKSMEHELRNAGFVGIRRASFGDAADPRFRDVEDVDRWNNCLGVDCRRAE